MSSLLHSRLIKLLFLFILLISAYKFYVNYKTTNELEDKIIALEKNIILAEEEKARLEEKLGNINDPEFIERIAREELGLVKPGELLIIPVEEGKDD